MKTITILGTSSNAGKSWVTTALCAWLKRSGVKVAPFKAQNMENNAYATLEGGEIGVSQALQAEACGLRPMAEAESLSLQSAHIGEDVSDPPSLPLTDRWPRDCEPYWWQLSGHRNHRPHQPGCGY